MFTAASGASCVIAGVCAVGAKKKGVLYAALRDLKRGKREKRRGKERGKRGEREGKGTGQCAPTRECPRQRASLAAS